MRVYLELRDPTMPDPATLRDATTDTRDWLDAVFHPTVEYLCATCGDSHPRLWLVRRSLADAMGHFPVINLNGERRALDMSLPTTVEKLPRDARELSPEDASSRWHDDSGSHTF